MDTSKLYENWDGTLRNPNLSSNKKRISKIPPGKYTFTESDYGGMRSTSVLSFQVTQTMDAKKLAKQIALETKYISPWGYMSLKKYDGDNNIKNVFPVKSINEIREERINKLL